MEREKAQETNSPHDDQETYRIIRAGHKRLETAASQLTFMFVKDYVQKEEGKYRSVWTMID
jgi:hypothetical protein